MTAPRPAIARIVFTIAALLAGVCSTAPALAGEASDARARNAPTWVAFKRPPVVDDSPTVDRIDTRRAGADARPLALIPREAGRRALSDPAVVSWLTDPVPPDVVEVTYHLEPATNRGWMGIGRGKHKSMIDIEIVNGPATTTRLRDLAMVANEEHAERGATWSAALQLRLDATTGEVVVSAGNDPPRRYTPSDIELLALPNAVSVVPPEPSKGGRVAQR
jgi:hypothetical protein